jgi:peroxiredoxin
VAVDLGGMRDVAARTAFLIEDGRTIVAAWKLGRELPDIDAVIAAATPQ